MADYILLKAAERYLERMQPEEQVRIVNALDALITDSEMLDIKPLKGRTELRLRVGKYRVLFFEDIKNELYIVTLIGPRGDVYS
ncbi:MAG: type II toxin-antitoxin system RelE/ParE family toxin [Hormoscilla sp.]